MLVFELNIQCGHLMFSAICFASMFIAFSRRFVDFLYVFVMFSCIVACNHYVVFHTGLLPCLQTQTHLGMI